MDSLELFSFCLENFQLSFCYLFLVWFHCQRRTLYGFMGIFVFFLICWVWLQTLFFFDYFHDHLKRTYILQLSGGVFCWYQCGLVPVGQWCWALPYPSTNFWERDVEVSNSDSGFSVSPFNSIRFWLSCLQLRCLVHTHFGFAVFVFCFWGVFWSF